MVAPPTPPFPASYPPPQVVGLAALACGLVSIGSCHDSLTDSLLQLMMDKEGEGLSNSNMRFVALGLALLYLGETSAAYLVEPRAPGLLRRSCDVHVMFAPPPGKQECGEVPLAALETVGDPLGKVARVLMEICSYAGEQWAVFTEHTTHAPWWGSHSRVLCCSCAACRDW